MIFNLKDFGAVGNGSVDDTMALQKAVNTWIAYGDGARLIIPPGDYRHTAPLLAEFTKTVRELSIEAKGATLRPDFSTGHGLEFRRTGAVAAPRCTIDGLRIDGQKLTDTASALLLMNGGNDSLGWLYRWNLEDVSCTNWTGDGFRLTGSAFETAFWGCESEAISNTTGCGLRIKNDGSGIVSSIDLHSGTFRGGKNNLFCENPQGGVKIFGGTYLTAQEDGIRVDNSLDCALFGVHVENAWQGGLIDPNWTLDQAGVRVSGRAYCYNIFGTANNDKMRCVLRVYTGASGKSVIVGGTKTGDVETYLRILGDATSTAVVIGVPQLSNGSNGIVDTLGV